MYSNCLDELHLGPTYIFMHTFLLTVCKHVNSSEMAKPISILHEWTCLKSLPDK